MGEQETLPRAFNRVNCVPEVKEISAEQQTVRHLISTNSVDRAGDIVEPKGVILDNYRKNPVVLADHGYSIRNIIGNAKDIAISNDGIESTTVFGRAGLGPDAFALVEAGMARAWSIGFRAGDYHDIKSGAKAKCPKCAKRWKEAVGAAVEAGKNPETDYIYVRGLHFLTWEMLEYSLVAIPMNQDVVSSAIQRGIDPAHIGQFFRPEDAWVEENIRRAFFPAPDAPVGAVKVLETDSTPAGTPDASNTGNTPNSEEPPAEAPKIERAQLHDILLGWRDKTKKQNQAGIVREIGRRSNSHE